jgi:hypothetical protein
MRGARVVGAIGWAVAAVVAASAVSGCGAEQVVGGATPTVTISPTTSASFGGSTSAPTTTPTGSIPGGPDPTDPVPLPTATRGTPVTLTGIPERGVEPSCLVLDRYLLVGGDRALLGSGAKVKVTGHTESDVMSYCQQGIYLVVDSLAKAG